MKKILALVLSVLMIVGLCACGASNATPAAPTGGAAEDMTFVIIPKCVHEWFDMVNDGAQNQAATLSEQLGVNVTVDYRAPSAADVTEQNTILEQAAATKPTGIAIDPVDYEGSKAVIEEIQAMGIPVMLFDAVVEGSGLASTGNDFYEQASLEAEKLVELLGGKGKVAVMHGVTTSATHIERYNGHIDTLAKYPDIEVIDGGISQDDVQTAQQQAAAVIAANPDLAGYLRVDGAAPIGISAAIEEAGKVGEITFVGCENMAGNMEYLKKGVITCGYSTDPHMQGSMAVLMMWQLSLGNDIPQFCDTGMIYLDENNVQEWIDKISK